MVQVHHLHNQIFSWRRCFKMSLWKCICMTAGYNNESRISGKNGKNSLGRLSECQTVQRLTCSPSHTEVSILVVYCLKDCSVKMKFFFVGGRRGRAPNINALFVGICAQYCEFALSASKCDHAKSIKWLSTVKELKSKKFCQSARLTAFLGLVCADKRLSGC